MSTKQTVIFTFMILFLGVMLYALGAWFYWSSELGSKNQAIDTLKTKAADLTLVLGGRGSEESKWGLRQIINDPEKGLKSQLDAAHKQAVNMEGGTLGGAKQCEILFNDRGKELNEKWPVAVSNWKRMYASWAEDNAKIKAALISLRKASKEKEERVASAQSELETELNNENVERMKIVAERKKQVDELDKTRVEHEEVLEKTAKVARDDQRTREVTRQGEIVFVALDLNRVRVSLGSNAGMRKGLRFDVYARARNTLLKKGEIEITAVSPSSADAVILPPKQPLLEDPQTHWRPSDPGMRYSVFSAAGADEGEAQPLVQPKTRADRIADYKLRKLEKELGREEMERQRQERESPAAPPVTIGSDLMRIAEGDWIYSSDFVPLMGDSEYQKDAVRELLTMQDINAGPLTFYFTDSVRVYRQELLKRLCERNFCRVASAMSPDVNYVVAAAGSTRAELVEKKISSKDKEKGDDASAEVKSVRRTLAALEEAKKFGAAVIADDEIETFFARRHRKQELLRGSAIQPGQQRFYIAGETKDRSAGQLKKFITAHRGVVANELDANVDYVVVGRGLSKEFFEEVRRKGLRIIREDELPAFFGLE